jgi:hypothetical protein
MRLKSELGVRRQLEETERREAERVAREKAER